MVYIWHFKFCWDHKRKLTFISSLADKVYYAYLIVVACSSSLYHTILQCKWNRPDQPNSLFIYKLLVTTRIMWIKRALCCGAQWLLIKKCRHEKVALCASCKKAVLGFGHGCRWEQNYSLYQYIYLQHDTQVNINQISSDEHIEIGSFPICDHFLVFFLSLFGLPEMWWSKE